MPRSENVQASLPGFAGDSDIEVNKIMKNIAFWILSAKALIVLYLCICTIVIKVIERKHIKNGSCKPGDLTYLSRLWESRQRDGVICTGLAFVGGIAGAALVLSMVIAS